MMNAISTYNAAALAFRKAQQPATGPHTEKGILGFAGMSRAESRTAGRMTAALQGAAPSGAAY